MSCLVVVSSNSALFVNYPSRLRIESRNPARRAVPLEARVVLVPLEALELVEGDVCGSGTVVLEPGLPQRYLSFMSRQTYYNSDFSSSLF